MPDRLLSPQPKVSNTTSHCPLRRPSRFAARPFVASRCLTLMFCSFTLELPFPTSRCGTAARSLAFMDKKRILASLVVLCILAVLIYLQYRHWRTFDWGTFWSQTHRIRKWHVFHGIVLIYLAYVVRAVRWKIFF